MEPHLFADAPSSAEVREAETEAILSGGRAGADQGSTRRPDPAPMVTPHRHNVDADWPSDPATPQAAPVHTPTAAAAADVPAAQSVAQPVATPERTAAEALSDMLRARHSGTPSAPERPTPGAAAAAAAAGTPSIADAAAIIAAAKAADLGAPVPGALRPPPPRIVPKIASAQLPNGAVEPPGFGAPVPSGPSPLMPAPDLARQARASVSGADAGVIETYRQWVLAQAVGSQSFQPLSVMDRYDEWFLLSASGVATLLAWTHEDHHATYSAETWVDQILPTQGIAISDRAIGH